MPKVIGPGFESWVQTQIQTRQNKNKISTSRDDETLMYQNSNDSFVRLTSAIDVLTSNADATNYQLFSTRFGGVGTKGQFSSGVGIGENLNSSYGAFSTDDYGYAPPPGIVSANIKSLNRGSFREANIKILAHSSTQFEIIEQIYLKLGFSMLLEWGHNSYFNNSSVYQPNNTHESYTVFLNNKSSQLDVQNQMQMQRSASFGNYDAMHGLVSNYSWDIEKDGSYNINLVISSVGEIVESLKTNVSHPSTVASTTDSPVDQPPLQYNSEKSTLNKVLYFFTTKIPPSSLSSKYYLQGNETTTSLINAEIGLTSNQNNNSSPTAQGDVVGFIFPELIGINDGTEFVNGQYFIKLGVLLRCIQNYTLLYNPDKKNNNSEPEALININTNEEDNFCFTYPRQGSLDPRVCLIDVIKDLTNKLPSQGGGANPTPPTSSYIINAIDYYHTNIKVEISNFGTGTYFEHFFTPFDPQIGGKDPFNLDSYGSDIGFDPATDNKKKADEFLQNKLGSLTTIVQKQQPQTVGSSPNLPQIWTAGSISTGGDPKYLNLLEQYSSLDSGAFTFYNDFKPVSWNEVTATENDFYLVEDKFLNSDSIEVIDLQGNKVKITTETYNARSVQYIKSTTGYTETNVSGGTLDVANDLFDKIRDGSRFRTDGYLFIGRTMNIYINMNYAAKIMQDYIDISNGSVSLFSFLSNMMKGVQHALGNINNFSVHYDENKNEFSIIDNTMLPQLGEYLSKSTGVNPFDNKPVVFQTHTLTSTNGSFVREAKVTSKISNNLMSQVTIGAQDNGNVVGSNSLAFSKWNTGLTDRIIREKTTLNNASGATQNDIDQKFYSNVGIVQNLYNAINDGNITDQQIDGAIDAGVDLFNYEIGMYVNEGLIPGIGLIPIDVELKMDGLSGMRIMDSYEADTKLLPKNYQNSLQFITTGISHDIQDNDWTTTIQSVSGPRYDGKTVTAPSPPKSHSVTINKRQNFKSTGPKEQNQTDLTNVNIKDKDLWLYLSWQQGAGGAAQHYKIANGDLKKYSIKVANIKQNWPGSLVASNGVTKTDIDNLYTNDPKQLALAFIDVWKQQYAKKTADATKLINGNGIERSGVAYSVLKAGFEAGVKANPTSGISFSNIVNFAMIENGLNLDDETSSSYNSMFQMDKTNKNFIPILTKYNDGPSKTRGYTVWGGKNFAGFITDVIPIIASNFAVFLKNSGYSN
jgi:hypothetical protein